MLRTATLTITCLLCIATLWANKSQYNDHMLFIENKGQITDQNNKQRNDIDFKVERKGVQLFIGNGQLHYQFGKADERGKEITDKMKHKFGYHKVETYRVDVSLIGANKNAKVITENREDVSDHFYIATSGVDGIIAHSYKRITYKDIYPGIDWVLYIKDNVVEYDFVVRPGSDINNIRLRYDGATSLKLDPAGNLIATTPMGTVSEHAPISYQAADHKAIASGFFIEGNVLSFKTGSHTGTLVIDPTLEWSTYYGGEIDGSGRDVSCDRSGNVYLLGRTVSTSNIATTGAYQQTLAGNDDAFLTKFNAAGQRVWSTYFGGASVDFANAFICDVAGNTYITGFTMSDAGIVTPGCQKDTLDNIVYRDAFLVKFNDQGQRVWGTYYGGDDYDEGTSVACDMLGNVYLAGFTTSINNIATANAHQTVTGGYTNAFLVQFNSAGQRQWGTYCGGGQGSEGYSVVCDRSGNIYLAGTAYSNLGSNYIATSGTHQETFGGNFDAFLVKFNNSGQRIWGTYYGSNNGDGGVAAECDDSNNVYLVGYTFGTNGIATNNSFQATYGGGASDAFLVKFDSTGRRQWGTYYGGAGNEGADNGNQITIDGIGNVFIGGTTNGSIAVPGGYQTTPGGENDAFMAKFNKAGVIQWGTYLGGNLSDQGYSICSDRSNNVYLCGATYSTTGIGTANGYQPEMGSIYGAGNAFLAKFKDCNTLIVQPDAITGNTFVCAGSTNIYSVPAVTGAASYNWILPNGWTGTSNTNSITVVSGHATDTIRVIAQSLCTASPEQRLIVIVDTIPKMPGQITGNTLACAGSTLTYTVPSATDVSSFNWILPSGWTGSSITNSITVTAGNNSDTIKVTAKNSCGEASAASWLAVSIDSVKALITPSGTIKFCDDDTAVLNANLFSGATYQWLLDGAKIDGASNQSYSVSSKGYYQVIVTSTNNCSDTSLTDTVIVHPLPMPAIDVNGSVLSTGIFDTYQWNKDGEPIAGADEQTYTIVINSGSYSVTVTDTNGCANTSEVYSPVLSVAPFSKVYAVRIYPNPARNLINIEAPVKVNVTVCSIDGKRLQNCKNVNTINIGNLADGVYLLEITDDAGRLLTTERIMKMPE